MNVAGPTDNVIRVALPVPLHRCFDYRSAQPVAVGQRVSVSFGRRQLFGVVLELGVTADCLPEQLKSVLAVLDEGPLLPAAILELCRFIAAYYVQPLGEVVALALPTWLRNGEPVDGLLPRAWSLSVTAPEQVPGRGAQAALLWEHLRQGATEAELRLLAPRARDWLKRWRELEYLQPVSAPVVRWTVAAAPLLTAEQRLAVERLQAARGFGVYLLAGITGSGKTEVYLQAAAAVLAAGRQVLLLVPEINLTPQLQQRVAARFPGLPLVCLHSDLAERERAGNWLRAGNGQARLVLGTRLALFTAMPELGLIILDEEHDSSFRQQDGVRFSGRDVAVWRARQLDVPVVLGSATPALETWHNAQTGRYKMLPLSQRAVSGAVIPALQLVDLRRGGADQGLSQELLAAMELRLERGEQSLVFLNRRGFAPVLFCEQCGWMSACRRCSVRLVYYRRDHVLRCHHCGWEERLPRACPDCGHLDLTPLGQGTQRIEEVLAQRFPLARVARIDRDTTRHKGSFAAAVQAVHEGEVDILVGTQMLAKGHDFPRLTLVGILGADAALYSPDFRAEERLFAQLLQVAGRAGRHGLPGQVLLQTRFPDHPVYQALLQQDWPAFARQQLALRREVGFPPYCHQAVLRADSATAGRAGAFLQQAKAALPPPPGVTVYDPVDAIPAMLSHRHRQQLLVQSPQRPLLQRFLAAWLPLLETAKLSDVHWVIDVDPVEL